jgi:glycosyltransferase involved in cell wall biosynthesis
VRLGFHSPKKGTPWGGSEELWAGAACELQRRGHQIGVSYPRWRSVPDRLAEIQRKGGRLFLLNPRLNALSRRFARHDLWSGWLRRFRPEFVTASLDHHTAELAVATRCLETGIPYAVLYQVANRHRWLGARRLVATRRALLGAAKCFFVSEENRQILEDQIAAKIERAEIVEQSFGVSASAAPAWPGDGPPWRLACVGRLHFGAKGQDVLLRVLRQEKWRRRELQVVFWGKDNGSELALRELIRLHGLERQAVVAGVSSDIEQTWSQHHGLVLASRYEGSARVLLEAMLCRRPVIATAIGRAHELVDEGETGFIAAAPEPSDLDAAMERAWDRRDQWQSMGELAGQRIRSRCSMTPEKDFADSIERLAGGDHGRS